MKKEAYTIEYLLNNISVNHLWKLIGTPLGLSQWFSEEVTVSDNNEYSFSWGGHEQTAYLLKFKKEDFTRFQWEEDRKDEPEAYFQFEILTSDLSNTVSLKITDFAEPNEKEDAVIMWDSQVDVLKRKNGL